MAQVDFLQLAAPFVREDASVFEAAKLMTSEESEDIFVLDSSDRPVGVLRPADIVRSVAKESHPGQTRVSEVMLQPAPSVQAEASGTEVAELLRGRGVRRVLVRRGSAFVGVIEAGDLFDLMYSPWAGHEVFKAISVRSRLRIAEMLSVRPLGVEDLARRLGVKPITVRHHLNVLRSQGIVEEIRPGSFGKVGRPSSLFSATGLILGKKFVSTEGDVAATRDR